MQKQLLVRIPSLLLLSVLLYSCASSTDPKQEDPVIRKGSIFTFHRQLTDTALVEVYLTDTVAYNTASIDSAFAGQMNAHVLTSIEDTSIYRVDATGDVYVYQPPVYIPNTELVFPEAWSILPIMSKTPKVDDLKKDTVVRIQTINARVQMSRYSGYLGAGQVMINGKTYATEEGYIESNVIVSVVGTDYATRVHIEYGYSPELKTFVIRRENVASNHDQSPIPDGGEILKLISFTL